MYHVSAQDVDEHMINVHYYYYYFASLFDSSSGNNDVLKRIKISST